MLSAERLLPRGDGLRPEPKERSKMAGFLSKICSRRGKLEKERFPSRWHYIVIHHSLTKDQTVVDWPAIRKYHKEVLGWTDIGYTFGIERVYRASVGDSYEILVGRQLNQTGAHCKQQGKNKDSIGICLIGNFDLMPPPKEQLDQLVNLTKALMEIFKIPKKNVAGHCDFASYKTCPGKAFPWTKFLSLL